jgi:hypothetical protein
VLSDQRARARRQVARGQLRASAETGDHVGRVDHLAALDGRRDLLGDLDGHLLLGLGSGCAQVGSADDLVVGDQRAAGGHRLVTKTSRRRRRPGRRERLDQGGLVDDARRGRR